MCYGGVLVACFKLNSVVKAAFIYVVIVEILFKVSKESF